MENKEPIENIMALFVITIAIYMSILIYRIWRPPKSFSTR